MAQTLDKASPGLGNGGAGNRSNRKEARVLSPAWCSEVLRTRWDSWAPCLASLVIPADILRSTSGQLLEKQGPSPMTPSLCPSQG